MVRMEESDRQRRGRAGLNPDGNERLTAAVGVLLLVPIVIELVSVLLGVHTFMSLHVFVGLLLIPPVLLKLASTGWRFARYYLRSDAYVVHGPPQLVMRLLAPLLVAATVVLFGSGVAMGLLHGHALVVARRLHGPASVVWIVLVGVHVLVYLKRSLLKGTEDIAAGTRAAVGGAKGRAYAVVAAVAVGVAVAAATVPAQHHWVNLHRDHDHRGESQRIGIASGSTRARGPRATYRKCRIARRDAQADDLACAVDLADGVSWGPARGEAASGTAGGRS
jgi:hypothetical protein